jgi:hypothetical protein
MHEKSVSGHLRIRKFWSGTDVEDAVMPWFQQQPRDCLLEMLHQLIA